MNRVRMPDGTLNHFTAASGVEIYRGHRLPKDLAGDLFFNEPVGRIVRRAKVVVREGLTQLQNAYPKSEFVRSTDPLFRPVAIHNTPDGTLMLVDMYTGIIQDAQFVGPNSYLRRKVDQYKLDAIHNFGRIWKITHDSTPRDQRAAADVQRDARPARSPSQARRTAGGATPPRSCSCSSRTRASPPALRTMARSACESAGADPRAVDARRARLARRRSSYAS